MAKQTFTVGQVLTAAQMTSLQDTAMGGGAASTKTANYVLVAADAGTTVAMNAAGSTTITVNTGLFSAGDTVFIQNIGAGACTITAGTATVSTAGSLILPQYDAGILYFTSASAAIFYDYIQVGAASPLTTKGDLYTYSTSDTRLAVGTNGTVLTAASGEATGLQWATPGGMTQLATGTLSGSQVDLTSISGSYNDLVLIIRNFRPNTDGQSLRMRLNADTGTSYTTNDFSNLGVSDAAPSSTVLTISGSTDSTTNYGIIYVKLFDYANAVTFKMAENFHLSSGDATVTNFTNAKRHLLSNITAAITQINLFPASGTFNAGTYILYGVK